MINAERVKHTFIELLKINSPSREERGVADYVIARLNSMGLEVMEDDAGEKIGGNAGNVIALLPGTVPNATPIFLSAHMDTVEPTDKLNLIIENDTVKTDGSTILGGDDKAGIAAILEGLAEVVDQKIPRGDVQVIFSISEEQGLRGASELDHSLVKAKMGYVFDTGSPAAALLVSAPTHARISVEITGKAAHAGVEPENGVNAIVAASNAISKMKLGRIDVETTANIGKIQGGKARNIVPDAVTINAEARSRNNEKLEAQIKHMTEVFEREAAKIGAVARVDALTQYYTYRWTSDDEIVKLAMAACDKIGVDHVFLDGGGGSDANIYNTIGIPTMVIGTAYTGPHSVTEQASVKDLAKTAEFVKALVESAVEAAGD